MEPSGEPTPQTQSPDAAPTPAAEPEQQPPQSETPAPPSQTHAEVTAEAAVLAIIDGSGLDAARRAPLRELQRACVRVPHISTTLTGDRRYKLYVQLLLDQPDSLQAVSAGVLAGTDAEKASEAHRAVAARVLALFPTDHFSSAQVVEAFVYRFAVETGFYFSPEHVGVFVAIASVVAQGQLESGEESLRMLSSLMTVVGKDFLTSNASRLYDGATRLLFRLLLQYHDPVLCTHLDHNKVDVGSILAALTRGLFVVKDDIASAYSVMDWIFILRDPALVPYVALALFIAARQQLLSLNDAAALAPAVEALSVCLPNDRAKVMDPKLTDGRSVAPVPVWSGKSLCQNADLTFRSTPTSAQRVLEFCLCPESGSINKVPEALEAYYAALPCLPLERTDIASSFRREPDPLNPTLQYVILDCRSEGSYNYARLPTAVLVGDVLSYDTAELGQLMARLLPLRGCHLSLFGTGRALNEELNLLKVVALYLVRGGFPFVSLTTGGFRSIIPLIRSNSITAVLNNGQPMADGEQRSLLAGLPTKLTELRETFLPTDTDAVRARAAELGGELKEKVKEGLSVAGWWGRGLVQRAQSRLSLAKEAAAAALASQTGLSDQASAHASPPTPPSSAEVTAGAATVRAGVTPTAPLQGRVADPRPPVHIFTLGDEEGDEDDFDLITAVPVRPLRGTVIREGAAAAEAPAAHGGSETTAARAPSAAAAQIAASIDKEFEDLFGS